MKQYRSNLWNFIKKFDKKDSSKTSNCYLSENYCLSKIDLSRANLARVNLNHKKFTQANLTGSTSIIFNNPSSCNE